MTTSSAVLTAEVVTDMVFTSMHFFGSAGFQFDSIGVHWNIANNVVIVAEIATLMMVAQVTVRNQGAMKIRRYSTSTEIFANANGVA